MDLDYFESAEDTPINRKRALLELKRHGIIDAESIKEFNADCWNKHSKGDTIQAQKVLAWLGY
tara:strand:- start:439 stop:627 length:189 start_codon:yes stop_codon:yes gene_type:complete